MRDRRDVLIAVLTAILVFWAGLAVGQGGFRLGLPAAQAQDDESGEAGQGGGDDGSGATDPTAPVNGGGNTPTPQIPTPNLPGDPLRPGPSGRTTSVTASDSDSNNRFVAVTCPVGSGESVLFVLDAENEQIATYRFVRNKGLEFLGGRKIDYDLRISGWNDRSKYTRDEMKRLFDRQRARAAAKALKKK